MNPTPRAPLSALISALFLLVLVSNNFVRAESLPYLEGEVRRIARDLEQADKERSAIYESLDQQQILLTKVEQTIVEVDAYAKKVRLIRQVDLVNASGQAMLDTYAFISFSYGSLGKSMWAIATSVVVELANSQIQNGWDESYKVAIDDFTAQAEEVEIVLARLNRTKKLSREAIISHGWKRGEELTGNGPLFRKIYLVEKAIEEAQKALGNLEVSTGNLIIAGPAAIATVEQKIVDLEAEKDEFADRLAAEIAHRKQEKIDWATDELPEVETRPLPEVTPKEPEETRLDQHRKILEAFKAEAVVELIPLLAEIQIYSDSVDRDYSFLEGASDEFDSHFSGTVIGTNTDILKASDYPIRSCVQRHRSETALLEIFQPAAAYAVDATSLIADLVTFESLRHEYMSWLNLANDLDRLHLQSVNAYPAPEDSAVSWLNSLKPADFGGDTSRLDWVADATSWEISFAKRSEDHSTIEVNLEVYEEVFDELATEAHYQYEQVTQAYDLFMFEITKLDELVDQYNQLMEDSGFASTNTLSYQFDLKTFGVTGLIRYAGGVAFDRMENWNIDWTSFDAYLDDYESLVDQAAVIQKEYIIHFERLQNALMVLEARPPRDYFSDLSYAAKEKETTLTTPTINISLISDIESNFDYSSIRYRFSRLPTLPEIDPDYHFGPVYEMRELLDEIMRNRWVWSSWSASAYEAKVDDVMRRLGDILAGGHEPAAQGYKYYLEKIRYELRAITKDVYLPVYWSTNPPQITRPPEDITVRVGDYAEFTVEGSGTALRYSWQGPYYPVTEFSRNTMRTRVFEAGDVGRQREYWVRIRNFKGYVDHRFVVTVVDNSDVTMPVTEATHGGGESVGSLQVVVGNDAIPWTAFTSNEWIHVEPNLTRSIGSVGYRLDPNTSGDVREGIITVGGKNFVVVQESQKTSLEDFLQQYGVSTAQVNEDPDKDGISHFLNYAYGLNPLVNNSPAMASVPGPYIDREFDVFVVSYLRSPLSTGIRYKLLASNDLKTWEPIDAEHYFVGMEGDNWVYEATVEIDLAESPMASFIRLQVESQP